MKIFIFGNPDLEFDSTPLKILPKLKEHFSNHEFTHIDPNEEWDVPDELYIIDTVFGIKNPMIFNSLLTFKKAPNISLHDFDAYANLRLLQKIGKLKKVKIFGIPPKIPESEALEFLIKFLK